MERDEPEEIAQARAEKERGSEYATDGSGAEGRGSGEYFAEEDSENNFPTPASGENLCSRLRDQSTRPTLP